MEVSPNVVRAEAFTGEAIQESIRKLPPEGGTVFLPVGTYVIKQPIVLDRDNISLIGQGFGTLLKLADKANAPVVIIGDAVTPPRHRVSGVNVTDLQIDGNRDNQTTENWNGAEDNGHATAIRNNGVTVRAAEDTRIERVLVRKARSGGIVLEKVCRRVSVNDFTSRDNFFDGFGAYETEDCVFTRLILIHNDFAGISADISFRHNIVSEAVITDNGRQGIFLRHSVRNLFSGLQIRRCGEHGVFLAQAEDRPETACVDNVFSQIVIEGCQAEGFRINDASCTGNGLGNARFANNRRDSVSEVIPGLLVRHDVSAR